MTDVSHPLVSLFLYFDGMGSSAVFLWAAICAAPKGGPLTLRPGYRKDLPEPVS